MGFLDDLARKVASAVMGSQEESRGLAQALTGLLTSSETGGVRGLVEAFEQKGLGNIISTWVGTGENAPVTPDQVEEGLGGDTVRQLAEKAGLSVEEAKTKLSELLPTLVDRFTPEGCIPEGSLLDKGKVLLSSLFSPK